MDETLKGSEAKLNYDLQFGKPGLACGDKGWKYVAPGDIDPNDLQKRNLRDVEGREVFKDTGAWVYKSRYLWIRDRSTTQLPNLCRTEPATLAVVVHQADMVTICLRDGDEPQPTIDRSEVKKGAWMDDVTDPGYTMGMSVTMLHEFAHLFGGWGNPMDDDWPNLDKARAGKIPSSLVLLDVCVCE